MPDNNAVILATRVGQNVIDYATGRELPADKLVVREVHNFQAAPAKRGALRIAKLQHAGQWNVAPLAVPNLMDALRKPPLSLRRGDQPQGALPPRPQPDLLSRWSTSTAGPRSPSRRRTSTPCGGTSSPAAAPSSATPPAAARPSTPPSAASSPSCLPGNPLVAHPPRRRALLHQGRLRPVRLPVHQGRRRTQGLPPARRRQDQRPLGHHLLQVRHRLRPGAAFRAGLQGLHLRVGPQDRRQHRHLRHPALSWLDRTAHRCSISLTRAMYAAESNFLRVLS